MEIRFKILVAENMPSRKCPGNTNPLNKAGIAPERRLKGRLYSTHATGSILKKKNGTGRNLLDRIGQRALAKRRSIIPSCSAEIPFRRGSHNVSVLPT
jgi:hypothetical protein